MKRVSHRPRRRTAARRYVAATVMAAVCALCCVALAWAKEPSKTDAAPKDKASPKQTDEKPPVEKSPTAKGVLKKPRAEDVLDEAFPKPPPLEKPPKPSDLQAAIDRGVAFLLKDQNKDGSWGRPRLRGGVEIYAPVPGAHHAFQTGVTALCIAALIEAGGDSAEVRQSLERAEVWMFERLPKLRRATPDALVSVRPTTS